jgi:hypothetical protein
VFKVLDHEMLKDGPDQPEGFKGNLIFYITIMKLYTSILSISEAMKVLKTNCSNISVFMHICNGREYLRTDPSINSLVFA